VLSPSLLAAGSRAVSLPVPASAAATFHGRDVFAPTAALLAAGAPIDSVGAVCLDPIVRRTPEARRGENGSVIANVALSEAMHRSHICANTHPPAMATPLTAAMTGFVT